MSITKTSLIEMLSKIPDESILHISVNRQDIIPVEKIETFIGPAADNMEFCLDFTLDGYDDE